MAMMAVTQLAQAVREKQRSAVDVTRAALDRVAAIDGRLGCFLKVDSDGAMDQAAAVDARIAAGDVLPLAGVPVGIKDVLCTRGLVTTCGSKILEGWIPPYDATVVARLRQAGAVILGKLNMDEFAMGSSNENSAYSPCRNPWDPARVPGGSSGGSAAAVAAELAALTLGSDTGGSIRQPAALCGVVGLKPTYGRVSRYGLVAFASSLDQVGPLANTVEDAALALQVMGGHDPSDATSIDAPQPDYLAACKQPIAGLRIGIPDEYFAAGLHGEVGDAVQRALALLEKNGARLVPVSLPHTKYAVAAYYLIATAEASSNLARFDGVRYGRREVPDLAELDGKKHKNALFEMYCRTRAAGFGAEVKRRILLGTYVLRSGYYDAYYRRASQVRTLIRRDFEAAFASCDVIGTPTSPVPAFRIGERATDPLSMYLADIYTIPCNLAGLPGISLPCGFTTATDDVKNSAPALPIGLQFLGPPLGEANVLRAAAGYERLTDWHTRRPSL